MAGGGAIHGDSGTSLRLACPAMSRARPLAREGATGAPLGQSRSKCQGRGGSRSEAGPVARRTREWGGYWKIGHCGEPQASAPNTSTITAGGRSHGLGCESHPPARYWLLVILVGRPSFMNSTFVVDLSAPSDIHQLSVSLGIDADVLAQLSSQDAEQFYRRHAIPKRSARRHGETRDVYEAGSEELRQVHRTLNRRLLEYVQQRDPTYPLPCCMGFVRKRSTLDNAAKHCGQPLLLRADIEDFFPTIGQARVSELFRQLSLKEFSADLLSRVVCFRGHLVPGLSASPLVANLIARGLDHRLMEIASRIGAVYTRYADDIAISGKTVPSLADVMRAVEAEGFQLSARKQRLTKSGQAHFVTGLSVQDAKRPHAPKAMKRRLRQELYFANKFGIAEHLIRTTNKIGEGINRLDGSVRYISFVERGTRFDFSEQWERLLARDDLRPDVPSNLKARSASWSVAIDETHFEVSGQHFAALAFSLYEDPEKLEAPLRKILADYLANPFESGRKKDIRQKGLHYADSYPGLQNSVIQQLPKLPMRTLVGITRIESKAAEQLTSGYQRLFQWGLSTLFKRADRKKLTLYVEQGPAVEHQRLNDFVRHQYSVFEKLGLARPVEQPKLEIVGKSFLAIAVPDFMLGVLGGYVKADVNVGLLRFEQVRDRFSLIADVDRRKYYSRRNPFQREFLTEEDGP